jgi:hypothetical protein
MVTIGFWQCLDFQNNKDYFFNNKKENIFGEDAIETLKSIFFFKKIFNYKIELLNVKNFFKIRSLNDFNIYLIFFKNFLFYDKRNNIKNKFKKN